MNNINTIPPFQKFCRSIGNIPSNYTLALSYEEQMLWLYDFLTNTLIPAINNNAEALSELQDFVKQLYQYVKNYFDNLDVQDEINNKLDQMVLDGTLENIISKYITSYMLTTVSTVNDMKPISFSENSFIKTLGFYSEGDGGSAFYVVKSGDYQPNNSTIFQLNNGLFAVLISDDDVLNSKQFGCFGNGVNDDYNFLQNAIDYCLSFKIPKLIILRGTYMLSQTIKILKPTNKYINFEIEGQYYPTFTPLANFTGDYLFEINSDITSMNDCMRYLSMKNLLLGTNDDFTFYNINGFQISELQYGNFENITVKNFKKQGVLIRDVYDSVFNNLKILNCGDINHELDNNTFYALDLQGSLDNVNACHFIACQVERCPLLLRIGAKSRHNQFTDSKFEQNAINYSSNAIIAIDSYSAENTFTNCQFVKNQMDTSHKYFIYSIGNHEYHQSAKFFCKLDGCMFTAARNFDTQLYLNVDGFTIVNCQFNNCAGYSNVYPFVFHNENIFTNNKLIFKNSNTNVFSIIGNNNIISNNIIELQNENPSEGAFLTADSEFSGNIFTNNTLKGAFSQPYSISPQNLGDNIFKNNYPFKALNIDATSGTLPALYFGTDVFVLKNTAQQTTYTNFRFAYNHQVLKIINLGNQTIIKHDTSKIVLKSGADVTLNTNDSITLIFIDGIWYEL